MSDIKNQDEKTSITKIINDDKFKNQLLCAIPTSLGKYLTPDRICRLIFTEFKTNPMLLQCTQPSLFGCIIRSAQLGLEPGNGLGHAYLIPFSNRKKNTKECTLIIGYRGLLDLARRSGKLISISAQVIYEKDIFEFEYGLNQKLKHIPAQGDRGKMIGAYAIAHLKEEGIQFEVMWKEEIDKIKASSQSASSSYSPWHTHYDEMARKTLIRRIFKYLPSSIEMQEAVILDENADVGIQDFSYLSSNLIEDQSEDSQIETVEETEKVSENQENKSYQEENKKSFLVKNITDLATKKDKMKMIMETIGSQYGCTQLDEMSVEDLEKIRRILID